MERIDINLDGERFSALAKGDGPLVLFAHGFPEIAYSWRHQIEAAAQAGFRAVALDMRGYGGSYAPAAIEEYDIISLVGDVAGAIAALGYEAAHLVGHDWGAAVAWNAGLLAPQRFDSITAISVPFQPRRIGRPPVDTFKKIAQEKDLGEFYMVRFQEPGLAERQYEANLDHTFRLVAYCCSGSTPAEKRFRPFLAPGEALLDGYDVPDAPPDWLDERDLSVFVEAYRNSGFAGPLNWYRNLDRNHALTRPWQGLTIDVPALYITGELDHVRSWSIAAEKALPKWLPQLEATHVVPGAGHWVQQESPDAVNEALIPFLLRRQEAAPRARGAA